MPKIVKNGLEYSGTPLEEVTAWPPTGDSVQIEQPLMGNTDISEVGDGTVTGAIAQNSEDITELNNGFTQETTGTIIKLISAGTLDTTSCVRVGNTVSVGGRIHTLTTTAYGNFFQIPEGFRPSSPMRGYGYMNVNNVGWVPMLCSIGTDGVVTLQYSSGSQCTQIGFSATYPVSL